MSTRGDIADALLEIASAMNRVSNALQALGNGNAASSMGAVEFHGVQVKEAGERIADSLSEGLRGIAAEIAALPLGGAE